MVDRMPFIETFLQTVTSDLSDRKASGVPPVTNQKKGRREALLTESGMAADACGGQRVLVR